MYSLLTVISWGVYGIFLHTGRMAMTDPTNGLYKAFLWVGVAYFLTAVLAPLALLASRNANWQMPPKGIVWSLIAGIVGAIGAFGVLLAFGAGGRPAVVMSIIFAGAPVVNAVVAIVQHPPAGGYGTIKPQFYVGILLAALGGYMVTKFKPNPPTPGKPAVVATNPTTPAAH
jgi:uncharacterized membrane protein YeaQ/YmgE (transglycosylase-associated protein family)